ncbi:MAG: cell division protein SepF, partial [Erysipelotrichaceae bacterium]|nr:cell division protein SepF [Erysipelotrichaceae bacterium]
RAVVVNLHKLDREYAQRTIDFLTGVVFALDGKIQKIGQNVILCSPSQIGVQGSINLGSPDDFDDAE